MKNIKKTVSYIAGFLLFATTGVAVAAPVLEYRRTILPETTNTYDLGSAVKQWLTGYFGTICLSGDCKSAWPTGGGGGSGIGWTWNGINLLRSSTTTDDVLIGRTATTGAYKLEISGTVGADNYVATSTTASSSFANGINLTKGCFSILGTCITGGGSSASSTLLSDSNTFSGLNAFTNALSTFAGLAAQATKLATARLINGVSFDGTANITITAASSTVLTDFNTWSGGNIFNRSTTTSATTTSLFSTTASSTNLFTQLFSGAGLVTCNGASQALTWVGGIFGCNTISAGLGASSTLLGDNNTFTGSNTIQFLTSTRSTSTNATTTGAQNVGTLVIGTLNGLLKGVSGSVTTATAGTDYENPLTFVAPLFRAANSISWFGLATTSQPASSNLLVSNGSNGVFGVATNTASCSGNTSCSSFTIIGSSPVVISSTGGGGASTTLYTDNGTFSGANIFANIVRSTTTQATTTNLAVTTLCLVGDTCRTTWPTGGSGVWPFTTGQTNFGVAVQATSTPLWFTGTSGVYASGTSRFTDFAFVNATGTGYLLPCNLDGAKYAGCFAGADAGAKINAAYASCPTNGCTIVAPRGTSTFSTKIAFETDSKPARLQCEQGTALIWSGSATSTVFNSGQNFQSEYGMFGCTLLGPDVGVGGTTKGVQLGGSLGAPGVVLRGNKILGFGTGIQTESNLWNLTVEDNTIQYNDRNVHIEPANNSGEKFSFINNNISDCNTTTKCFYSDVNGTVALNLDHNIFDDAQIYLEDGNISWTINGGDFENPNEVIVGRYTYLVCSSGGYSNGTITGTQFSNGASTQANSPYQFISAGCHIKLVNPSVQSFSSVSSPAFIGTFGDGFVSGNVYEVGVAIDEVSTSTSLGIIEKQDGKVGIGTSTPYSTLGVYGNVDVYNGNGLNVYATNGNYTTITHDGGKVHVTWPWGFDSGATYGSGYTSLFPPTGGALFEGGVGIGTSSPWGKLSVVADGVSSPIFVIATSSTMLSMFTVNATTTTMSTASSTDSGVRFSLGDASVPTAGYLDQFMLNGRMNTGDWHYTECTPMSNVNVSADTSTVCGSQFAYNTDSNTVALTANKGTRNSPYLTMTNPVAVANAGNGLFFGVGNGFTQNVLQAGTNTPVMETSMGRSGNATGTLTFFGFTNLSVSGTTYETEPTQGCYLAATSSIVENWRAVCRDSAGGTIIDTGFSSTTIINSSSTVYPTRMRVELTDTRFTVYMSTTTTSGYRKVANITTNIPKTTNLVGGLHSGWTTAGTASSKTVRFGWLRAWWKTPNEQVY